MTAKRTAMCLCILALLVTAAAADTYIARTNVPIRIALPMAGSADGATVYMKARGGEWQKADYEVTDNRLILSPNPRELGGTEIIMVINPPADLVIDDSNPPLILGIKADGEPLPAEPRVDLGRVLQPPQTVTFGIADRENALDLDSLQVMYDNSRVDEKNLTVESISRRQARIDADVVVDQYGNHEVTLTAADRSPEANTVEVAVVFEKIAGDNYLRPVSGSVNVKVDSNYPNYPSIEPLTDGHKFLSGAGAGNDVTWASAENDAPHWIAVTMEEEKELSEVTIYWAYSGSTFHTSQKIMIQVPADSGWETVYESPDEGPGQQRSTTVTFDPVTTDSFRIFQPPGGGSSGRPDLMWVAEVEAR